MSYHLGTELLVPTPAADTTSKTSTTSTSRTYGYWRVDDPATVARLRELGIDISSIPAAKDAIDSRIPALVLFSDRGADGITVSVRSSWGTKVGTIFRGDPAAALRTKLESASSVPSVPPESIDRVSLPSAVPAMATKENVQPTIGGRSGGVATVGGRRVGVPVPADQPSLPVSDQSQNPSVPELPPIAFDPSLERAIDAAVGRKSSNTGLYIGLGVAAAAVAALVFWPRNR